MRFAGSQLTNFLSGTNFDNIGKAGIVSRANENNASVISDSYVDRADIAAEATVQSAKYGASATRAQGAAQGQSSMFSGLASGIGSIAGGIAKMPKTNTGTNRGISPFSQPHSSGIGREALGGYDL